VSRSLRQLQNFGVLKTNSFAVRFPNSRACCVKSFPIEVIIVDNFSNEYTTIIAKAFGAKVAQWKSNPALARNVGIAGSAGKHVFFVDSDQILFRCVVEECVTKCNEENAEMVKVPELFIGEGF